MELFGFNIKRGKEKVSPERRTFKDAITDNDAINITTPAGHTEQLSEIGIRQLPQFTYVNDVEKIKLYRKMAQTNVHIGLAVTELKNEAFILNNPHKKAFEIGFYSDTEVKKNIQERVIQEADELYKIINFDGNATEWFESWYVDSRFFMHVIVDESKPQAGILGVVPLNPINTRKVKLLPQSDNKGSIDLNKVKEVYIYKNNFKSFDLEQTLYMERDNTTVEDIILSKDSVIDVVSGLRDKNDGKTIGHLEKAIIPYNNLKMLEESMVIFRIVRAPMRRAFYIDISNLQPKKGEKYIKDTRDRFKVDVNYNSDTGSVGGDRHIHSILEDYYIPRQGNKNTEIQTLDGQTTQDILEEVEYAREQLWLGLNVPKSRFKEEATSLFTRPSEVQRDEYRLNLFISKCRQQFMKFFDQLLLTQLLLKNVIKDYEWNDIRGSYFYEYTEDNLFVEYKEMEKLSSQLDLLQNAEQWIGKYFSREHIRKVILKQNDDDIKKMLKEIDSEVESEKKFNEEE